MSPKATTELIPAVPPTFPGTSQCHHPSWHTPDPLLVAQVPAELRVPPATSPPGPRLSVYLQQPRFQLSNKKKRENLIKGKNKQKRTKKKETPPISCTKSCFINENNDAFLVLPTPPTASVAPFACVSVSSHRALGFGCSTLSKPHVRPPKLRVRALNSTSNPKKSALNPKIPCQTHKILCQTSKFHGKPPKSRVSPQNSMADPQNSMATTQNSMANPQISMSDPQTGVPPPKYHSQCPFLPLTSDRKSRDCFVLI